MPLQPITIDRIESSCGIKKLCQSLKNHKATLKSIDKYYIDTLIIYLRCLYNNPIDMVSDLIEHKYEAEKTLDILKNIFEKTSDPNIQLIHDILKDNLNYSNNIKKLY